MNRRIAQGSAKWRRFAEPERDHGYGRTVAADPRAQRAPAAAGVSKLGRSSRSGTSWVWAKACCRSSLRSVRDVARKEWPFGQFG
jgi:hypothetical protein